MHKNVNSNRSLTIQISGGVGNQLFQYYAGFYAASRSGRLLIIDDLRVQQGSFYKNRINSEMSIVGLRGLHGLEAKFIDSNPVSKILSKNAIAKFVPIYKSNLLAIDYSPSGEIGVGIKESDLDFSHLDIQNIRIRGNLQSVDIVQAAIKLGALSRLSVKELGDHAERLINHSLEAKPIGMHLRLMDYGENTEQLVSASEYYTAGIEHLKAIIPDSPLWLFTDDVKMALRLLPKSITSQISQIINPESLSDLETMLVMSNCEGLVIANSTFSFWAGFFQKSQMVVAPKPWFKSSRQGRDMNFNFPLGWKTISW